MIQNTANKAMVFMDGNCNFCNRLSDLLRKLNTKNAFQISNIYSDESKKYLLQKCPDQLSSEVSNTLLVVDNGMIYTRFDAVLQIVRYLPGLWKMLMVFHVFPRSVMNGIYSIIANNRYRWFGKTNQCIIT